MNRLELANAEIHEKAHAVLQKYHHDLASAGVKLTVFFSRKVSKFGEYLDTEESLRCNRQPAYATIRVATESERALGFGDAVVVLDYHGYNHRLKDTSRDALISHELHHLKPKQSKDGNYLRHANARPRLLTVPHDLEIGIFLSPIRVFGRAATDFVMADTLFWDVKTEIEIHNKAERKKAEGGTKERNTEENSIAPN